MRPSAGSGSCCYACESWYLLPLLAAEHKRLRQLVGTMTVAAASARAPFEWADGPLITAMRQGDIILIDELNLAEDAVLERLNRSAFVQPNHGA